MKPTTLSRKVGRRLAELRAETGLPLRQYARLVGMDAGYLSRLEHGHRLPGFLTLRRLARATDYEDLVELLSL